ncbi:MAG: DUF5719 family protein [Actinomycetota bacterium]|nr:DUF5719 family protein [Actinomycetota bacterium]
MTDPSNAPTPGRRIAAAVGSRADVTVVLAVLLPLLTVAALLLVRPGSQEVVTQPPERTVVTRSTVVCPSGASESSLTTMSDEGGPVAARVGKDPSTVDLAPRSVTSVPGDGPVVVTGEGVLAPGLVGGVFRSPLAAASCSEPAPDQWFTGVGAGARHNSVLELVNPDAGPAVVDSTLIGQEGVIDAPELRGVAVPARGVVRIDLATTIPRRDELTLRVTTSRGRVSATMRDHYDQLGAGAAARDWLPAQAAPSTTNTMLGMVPGSGQRNLVLTNAGTDETRAAVQVVTEDSVFTPQGVKDVVVGPESVTRVSLSKLLPKDALGDAIGLVVTSGSPLTATVRSFVDGDLSHSAPGEQISSSTVLTPPGRKQVVLAGADGAGTVTVVATDESGQEVARRRVDVVAKRGFAVDLPSKAALVEVTVRGTTMVGSVTVTGDGVAVLPLTPLVLDSLVAQVRPGL